MDFMLPPTYDIFNIQTWKVKMSLYLKALSIHVYFVTIKNSYYLNGKYLEANAKAIHALKSTLNDEYLFRVSNFDSDFFSIKSHPNLIVLTSLFEKCRWLYS